MPKKNAKMKSFFGPVNQKQLSKNAFHRKKSEKRNVLSIVGSPCKKFQEKNEIQNTHHKICIPRIISIGAVCFLQHRAGHGFSTSSPPIYRSETDSDPPKLCWGPDEAQPCFVPHFGHHCAQVDVCAVHDSIHFDFLGRQHMLQRSRVWLCPLKEIWLLAAWVWR